MNKSRQIVMALFATTALVACSGTEQSSEPSDGSNIGEGAAAPESLQSPDSAENKSTENTGAPGAQNQDSANEQAPEHDRTFVPAGEPLQLRAGALSLGEGVELLATVDAANGNQLQFLSRGEFWSIVETGPVGNSPIAADIAAKVSDPLQAFKLVAPDATPPESLLNFVDQMPQRTELSESAAEVRREEVRQFEELKKQSAQPAADGLNQSGSCSYSWFTSNVCTGTNFKTRFNTNPENTQFKNGLTYFWEYARSSASEGAGFVCGDIGAITLRYWTAAWGTFVNLDVQQGYWGWGGKWYSQSCYQSCSGWSCSTVCNPSYQNASTYVDGVGGTDRYHFCAWYNPDGD